MLRPVIKISMLATVLLSSAYAYTPAEDALMSCMECNISGTFGQYDFADSPEAYDWAFTTSNGKTYQLRGAAPTEENVFGWKEVKIAAPEPKWYMFQFQEDVDGDGSRKFDWGLIASDSDTPAVYKLEGVSSSGTFEYSERLNVNASVNDKKMVTAQQGTQVAAHDQSSTKANEHLIISETPVAALSDAQKESLLFMYNEEKMARDLYVSLNALNPIKTLENIALRAEQTHMEMVYELITKYDLDTQNLTELAPNEFSNAAVQNLYDALYERGAPSLQASLEVGCMVEVTDINDLNVHLAEVQGIEDLEAVFENLRAGSYTHYWAFDTALKNMGVSEGCCSLGDDFCKTSQEYPQTSGHR
jgi:hypothetical protein